MAKRRNKKLKSTIGFNLLVADNRAAAKEIKDIAGNLATAFPEVDLQLNIVHSYSELEESSSAVVYDAVLMDINLSQNEREREIMTKLPLKIPHTDLLFFGSKDQNGIESLPFEPKVIYKALKKGRHPLVLALRRAIRAKLRKENLDQKVIVPIEQSITVINDRVIKAFKNDPELLRTIDPILFEEVVANLFEEEGYKIILTPPRADGGKDIYAFKTDLLTQVKYLVECKRYVPPLKVDVSVARQLYGAVQQEQASGGIIVTTSYFTKPARDFAQRVEYQLFLTDFDDLTQWFKRLR